VTAVVAPRRGLTLLAALFVAALPEAREMLGIA